jgi:AcrR family transcriptional regulator
MAPSSHRRPSALQKQKSQQTQSLVLDAAIEILADGSARNATSQRLAKVSGVSWGAIQYQFGSKAHIFEALLDRSLDTFASGLNDAVEETNHSLDERVRSLVERVSDLLREPIYRAFRQMLHDPPLLEELGLTPASLLTRMHATMAPGIRALLSDQAIAEDQIDLIHATVFASLSGIIEQSRYDGFPEWMTREQLRGLEAHLIAMITNRATTSST